MAEDPHLTTIATSEAADDTTHEPLEVATLFASKLASRERHVCFLLGAGASKSAGLPDMVDLKRTLLEREANAGGDDLARLLADRTVEQGLTWLRKAGAVLESGEDTLGDYTKAIVEDLDQRLSSEIMLVISESTYSLSAFEDLARWLRVSAYTRPVELFTLNYDLLLEEALENVGAPYFDGFIGSYSGKFRADLVDSGGSSQVDSMPTFFHRLWKLHGSISWTRDDENAIVRLGRIASSGEIAAIHPSESKYDDSRRAPFVILHDRLRRSLLEPETMLVVAGYSFGDQHVNELIYDAVKARPRSEFVFTFFGDIPDEVAALAVNWKNVTALGRSEAITGGVRGGWEADPDKRPGSDVWDSTKKFQLGDFGRLSSFLARSASLSAPTDQTAG
ncbi:SIR2 family protein [Mycetocola zhujimingii]|uniref:SIR2 family protein n=1 Tax=Mycetocola zhujimingii TaxID=2079792 RepID=A0A2U1TCQ3_9MICO|nr:SIR2 family protein [Mycetocola zhujimingii]PWC06669.1 SIR2 family protein [Mycetocola zhujimingii]